MPPFDSGPSEDSTQEEPHHVRFRAQRDLGGPTARRSWDATYAHEDGWARFKVVVDMTDHTVAFIRSADDKYGPMLRALAGKRPGARPPAVPPSQRHESLTFDMEVVGTRMARLSAGVFNPSLAGDWFVIQVFLPRSAESFIMAFNDMTATGELAILPGRSVSAVLHALAAVFS